LILLLVALIVGVAGVLGNAGSAHTPSRGSLSREPRPPEGAAELRP